MSVIDGMFPKKHNFLKMLPFIYILVIEHRLSSVIDNLYVEIWCKSLIQNEGLFKIGNPIMNFDPNIISTFIKHQSYYIKPVFLSFTEKFSLNVYLVCKCKAEKGNTKQLVSDTFK